MSRTDTATDVAFDSRAIYEMRQHIDTVNVELAETEQRLNNVSNKGNGAAKATRNIAEATRNVTSATDSWLGRIAKIGAGYLSIRAVMGGIKAAVGLSDKTSQISARLNLIVDDNGSVDELENRIRASAKRSRASYETTADAISKMGMLAGESFGSNMELIAFTELLNKSFVVAGTTATEKSSAMLQLTQAMASGRLQGDEFRSIMENAPMVADAISQYMGVSKGELKELSSDGVITADIIKNAMINAADDINQKFEKMPMTWEQLWVGFVDDVKQAFKPLSEELNELAASENISCMFEGLSDVIAVVAAGLAWVTDKLDGFVGSVQDNWEIIRPILIGLAAVWAVVQVATLLATIQQWAYNIALYACPLVWVIAAVIAVIVVFFSLIAVISKVTGKSISAFGIICGVLNYLKQGIIYLGQDIANVFLGAWEVVKTFARNLERAFEISVSNVKKTFFGLGGEVLKIIGWIAQKLNALPFFSFDDGGIMEKADEWAAKAAAEQGYRKSYESLADAYRIGASKYNTRPIGWEKQAYEDGYNWGADKVKEIGDFFNEFNISGNESDADKYAKEMEDFLEQFKNGNLAENTDETAKNTDKTAKNTEKTNSLMELIRDNLEKKAILDYTTSAKTVTYDLSGATNIYHNTGEAFDAVKELANYLRGKEATSAEGI